MRKQVCIIGGGSAGLAAELGFRQRGIEVTVCERVSKWGPGVLGFILLENGLSALDKLGLGEVVRSQAWRLKEFILRAPNGRELTRQHLPEAYGIQRDQFLTELRNAVPESSIRPGLKFSHFQYDNSGRAIAAHFENGHRVEADLFLGCDGMRSAVRKELFPEHSVAQFRVREMTCLVDAPEIADKLGNQFIKTQDENGGLAFGMVPCGGGKVIWYLQFDSERWQCPGTSAEQKQNFVTNLVGSWAQPIPELIQRSDFSTVNIWVMPDMNPLPRYSRSNVALVGDAAHIFLPFTSQGVNSALFDAVNLAEHLAPELARSKNFEPTLENYSRGHLKMVKYFVESGRRLAKQFLNPAHFVGAAAVPLAK